MALTLYNIKKWFLMLTGNSILHVYQGLGEEFVPGELRGYHNNLKEKVIMCSELLDNEQLPQMPTESGLIDFPVGIIQYGLGAYDLFLQTGDDRYRKKMFQVADWLIVHQEENGAWNNFFFDHPEFPYGAMCQGEGASLLVRAYKESSNELFLDAAKRAVEFMLLPLEKGGTTRYEGDDVYLHEYMHKPIVLNGWIFALFGLYDISLVCDIYSDVLKKTVKSLENKLSIFDCGYWSMYEEGNMIASPFYHKLHIAQLEAMYLITGENIFRDFEKKFEKYEDNKLCYMRAFFKKAKQKLME